MYLQSTEANNISKIVFAFNNFFRFEYCLQGCQLWADPHKNLIFFGDFFGQGGFV